MLRAPTHRIATRVHASPDSRAMARLAQTLTSVRFIRRAPRTRAAPTHRDRSRARERSRCVGAARVRGARRMNRTLVNVCASLAIARESGLACTRVAIRCVGARSIGAARSDSRHALVDVTLVNLGNSEHWIASACPDCEQAARETSHHVSHYNADADNARHDAMSRIIMQTQI